MDLNIQIQQTEEYDKLLDSLYDLNEIQKNIAELLVQQDEKIDSIEENVYYSKEEVKIGLDSLIEAKKLQFTYTPIIIGGVLGGLVGGPLGFVTGLKYAGITTGTGTLLGGIGGYAIQ